MLVEPSWSNVMLQMLITAVSLEGKNTSTSKLNESGAEMFTRTSMGFKPLDKSGEDMFTRTSMGFKTLDKSGEDMLTRTSMSFKPLDKSGEDIFTRTSVGFKPLDKSVVCKHKNESNFLVTYQ